MDSPRPFEGVILFWGRGFAADPAEYGFIIGVKEQRGVYHFDATKLAAGSSPPRTGARVRYSFDGSQGGRTGAHNVSIVSLDSIDQVHWWEADVGQIIRCSNVAGTVETFAGVEARFDTYCVPGDFSKLGGYVRCRIATLLNRGVPVVWAFDVVPIDYSNRVERAHLKSYLSLTKSPLSPTVRVGKARGKTSIVAEPPRESQLRVRYVVSRGELLMWGRRRIKVQLRYRPFLEAITARVGDGTRDRKCRLDYHEVAVAFEHGKMLEDENLSRREVDKRLRQQIEEITANAKVTAHEFSRQFSKWLRHPLRGIDPKEVFRCDRQTESYVLGSGWNPKRIAVGDAEARFVRAPTADAKTDVEGAD